MAAEAFDFSADLDNGVALYSVNGMPLPCNGSAVSVPLGRVSASIV